ncbi:MAG: hypothetical protein R3F11_07910 [Verrucomicrobiales bacterium]
MDRFLDVMVVVGGDFRDDVSGMTRAYQAPVDLDRFRHSSNLFLDWW